MGKGEMLLVYPKSARAKEEVEITIKIDNTDWNPLNSEVYRIAMHDNSKNSPQRCMWYDKEGRVSPEHDINKNYIAELVVNAFTDEILTSKFIMPDFDVEVEFELWRRVGNTWVLDDRKTMNITIETGINKLDLILYSLLLFSAGYFTFSIAKLFKRGD
ncbi:MAG: hypothetical protein QXJ25_02275 [Candidatus Aenigmatarchaeota archaeon]